MARVGSSASMSLSSEIAGWGGGVGSGVAGSLGVITRQEASPAWVAFSANSGILPSVNQSPIPSRHEYVLPSICCRESIATTSLSPMGPICSPATSTNQIFLSSSGGGGGPGGVGAAVLVAFGSWTLNPLTGVSTG